MTNARAPVAPPWRLGATLVLATSLALVLPYLQRPEVRLDFDEDTPARLPHTRGIYPSEHTGDGLTFAWTSQNARIMLPALPRGTPWTLTVRARAPRPAGTTATPVTFAERGATLALWTPVTRAGETFAETHLALPASRVEGLRLDIASGDSFAPGPGDNRVLALQIDSLVLVPEDRWAAIPWMRVALTVGFVAVGAALVWIVTASRAGLWAGVVAAVAIGLLARRASWLYLTSFDGLAWAAAPALAVLAVGVIARWVWRPPRPAADAAIALSAWFTAVKYGLLIHPAMTTGDTAFHQHRFARVDAGDWLFTSAGPGGEFPYPPALYAVVNLFVSGSTASPDMLRGMALTFDSIAGLLLALAIVSAELAVVAPIAVLLWQTAPALFQVQALTYLTNSFGNSWSAIALAFLVRGVGPARSIGWLAAAAAAALVVALSHVSSFVLLAGALAAAGVLAAIQRRWHATAAVVAVLAFTIAASWVVYYRHFTPLYAARLAAPAPVIDPTAAPPLQRDEAHQTAFHPGWPALRQRLAFIPSYVNRYVGLGLLGLALLAPFAGRGRAPATGGGSILAWGAISAVIAALAVGQLTPIDLRYYLVAASALAPVGAVAVAAAWASGEAGDGSWRRGLGTALAAVAILQGSWYMARFLWYPLPR